MRSGPLRRGGGERGTGARRSGQRTVNVSGLPEVGQNCAIMIGVVAIGVATREGVHQCGVVGGVGVCGDSGSTIVEECKCPGELFLLVELFGVVDELELSAPFAEVTTPVVSGRALPWLMISTFCANWVRFWAKVWRMD